MKKQEESTVVPPVFFDCLRLKGQKSLTYSSGSTAISAL